MRTPLMSRKKFADSYKLTAVSLALLKEDYKQHANKGTIMKSVTAV
jgi:hypothetical protein